MKSSEIKGKGRGGPRPGSGRKRGSKTTRTRKVAEAVALTGMTPLEVMCKAMLLAQENGDMRSAASYAQMAAPYIHPRLSTVNANHNGQVAVSLSIVSEFDE